MAEGGDLATKRERDHLSDERPSPDETAGVNDGGDVMATDVTATDAPETEPAAEETTAVSPKSDAEPEVAPETGPETGPETSVVAPVAGQGFAWYVLRVQSGREDSISNNLRKRSMLSITVQSSTPLTMNPKPI